MHVLPAEAAAGNADDPKAGDFAPFIEGPNPVLVLTIVLYEVYRKLCLSQGKIPADRFASQALCKRIAPLDEDLALAAARVGLEHSLAMADAIIYATARTLRAQLVTSDTDFGDLPGVTLI